MSAAQATQASVLGVGSARGASGAAPNGHLSQIRDACILRNRQTFCSQSEVPRAPTRHRMDALCTCICSSFYGTRRPPRLCLAAPFMLLLSATHGRMRVHGRALALSPWQLTHQGLLARLGRDDALALAPYRPSVSPPCLPICRSSRHEKFNLEQKPSRSLSLLRTVEF